MSSGWLKYSSMCDETIASASGVWAKYSLSEIGRRMPSPPLRASGRGRPWFGVGGGTARSGESWAPGGGGLCAASSRRSGP